MCVAAEKGVMIARVEIKMLIPMTNDDMVGSFQKLGK